MSKTISLDEMVVIGGLSEKRTEFLEECKKIVKESTFIIVEKNPNFNPKLSNENPYQLIVKPSQDIMHDAEIETGKWCYIELVNTHASASANRKGITIGYKGYTFHINYGEIPEKI